jgi:pyruvate formate lyase activating enzyme
MSGVRQLLLTSETGSLKKLNLIPFHKTGSAKYKKFNIPCRSGDIQPPSEQKMVELKKFFQDAGLKVKVGG